MRLKTIDLDGKTYAEVNDGKPIYTHDDGKDAPFDVPDMYAKLTRDGRQNADLRRSLDERDARLRSYEGIEDPEAARRALETVANLKSGELVAAGQVEEIKNQANRAADERQSAAQKEWDRKCKAAERERDEYREALFGERVSTAFSRSKFITDKIAVPPDLLQAKFGGAFKFVDGKMVPHHLNGEETGKPIYSRTRGGEIADFDEAIERLVDETPYRDSLLKGTGSSGAGAGHGRTVSNNTMSRQTFDGLNPMQQREVALKRIQIVD